jgi:amidophosphoribosyltransferase
MAKLGDFVAFQAAIALLKENGKKEIIDGIYRKCKEQEHLPKEQIKNYVKEIYDHYTPDEVSKKISVLLTPENTSCEVEIIFQSLRRFARCLPQPPWRLVFLRRLSNTGRQQSSEPRFY